MIRTSRKLKDTLDRLFQNKEILIKDVETEKYLKIENISIEKVESDPIDTRYVINCSSVGGGCVTYK